jgi:hypothetical protein
MGFAAYCQDCKKLVGPWHDKRPEAKKDALDHLSTFPSHILETWSKELFDQKINSTINGKTKDE